MVINFLSKIISMYWLDSKDKTESFFCFWGYYFSCKKISKPSCSLIGLSKFGDNHY